MAMYDLNKSYHFKKMYHDSIAFGTFQKFKENGPVNMDIISLVVKKLAVVLLSSLYNSEVRALAM